MTQPKAPDSNAVAWPVFSGFEPLTPKSKEIRVLQLEHDCTEDLLKFRMIHIDIHRSPFFALSYSWGAPVADAKLKRIVINGKFASVRPNLWSFMQTFARHDRFGKLWVDAICINQNDTLERNYQIAMMGEIYKAATKVYVWLGLGDDDTNYAFEHIKDSSPQTPYDALQFSSCVEKIFKSSYWTRRWVIQEFSMARQLIVACGDYIVPWERITGKINEAVLANDDHVLKIFDNFKQLASLGVRKDQSLLELMLRYQASRCVDRRDKAFALRAIANDGPLLDPKYEESVADVYFRVLSQLPTANVLPEMRGFRWPHNDAYQLLINMSVTTNELLGAIKDQPSDRLFTSLQYFGVIELVREGRLTDTSAHFSSSVQVIAKKRTNPCSRWNNVAKDRRVEHLTLLGCKDVQPDDLIYLFADSSQFNSSFYVVFRPHTSGERPIGMLVHPDHAETLGTPEQLELIRRVYLDGIVKCVRDETNRNPETQILVHISRGLMLLLWSLGTTHEHWFSWYQKVLGAQSLHGQLVCPCICEGLGQTTSIESGPNARLEILRSSAGFFEVYTNSLEAGPHDLHLTPHKNSDCDYSENERHTMISAAEDGLVTWMDREYSMDPSSVEILDKNNRNALSWAASAGSIAAIKKLLGWISGEGANFADRHGFMPLTWAVMSGRADVVQALLASPKINPNFRNLQFEAPPLSWATIGGHTEVVEVLLASGRVDASITDADFQSPLLWAAMYGHERIVELLLATKKVDINVKDSSGRTPLSWAAGNGFIGIMEKLLAEDGIEPDLGDGARETPLRFAALGKQIEAFKLLLATGKVRNNVKFEYSNHL